MNRVAIYTRCKQIGHVGNILEEKGTKTAQPNNDCNILTRAQRRHYLINQNTMCDNLVGVAI